MGYEEDKIYEGQKMKTMTNFWTTMTVLVAVALLTGAFMYSQYRTPDSVHAANCKSACEHGVKSFEGSTCICLVPPMNPPVRDVKALSCTCMPVPVGEEEKREDAMRRIMEEDAAKAFGVKNK